MRILYGGFHEMRNQGASEDRLIVLNEKTCLTLE